MTSPVNKRRKFSPGRVLFFHPPPPITVSAWHHGFADLSPGGLEFCGRNTVAVHPVLRFFTGVTIFTRVPPYACMSASPAFRSRLFLSSSSTTSMIGGKNIMRNKGIAGNHALDIWRWYLFGGVDFVVFISSSCPSPCCNTATKKQRIPFTVCRKLKLGHHLRDLERPETSKPYHEKINALVEADVVFLASSRKGGSGRGRAKFPQLLYPPRYFLFPVSFCFLSGSLELLLADLTHRGLHYVLCVVCASPWGKIPPG